ncbi:serine hydrolase domain-containing protein [Alkalihalobacterium elongatum]|uniref:serine hydrolase domain-containing protein n=1 Tax=Alkalihalobacterium elongatum TaxID=2675466 RepID=UPI001C1F9562|nr:serine hydrolase domain-containing protein [Alkalihalobacterium elongatum]
MNLDKQSSDQFTPVLDHIRQTQKAVSWSGSACIVIHKGNLVTEQYWGNHSLDLSARPIQADSQFHVASVRKSYIGFAVAYAVYKGYISSIDDLVTAYVNDLDRNVLEGTTIRHLLTHAHGLHMKEGSLFREFPAGTNWAYRMIGIDLLAAVIKGTTGQTIAGILQNEVFEPIGFRETGWYAKSNEKLVDVIRDPYDRNWVTSESTAGDKMNMYVSTRDLAYWGYLHLKMGEINGEQKVAKEIIELATALQSPRLVDQDLPQNGFLWFVKDLPALQSEIGPLISKGAYQILGYTNVALLVIPKHDIVVVRMLNSFGSPKGYDYLADIRNFGDTVMGCL